MKTHKTISVNPNYWNIVQKKYPNKVSSIIDKFIESLANGNDSVFEEHIEIQELIEKEEEIKKSIADFMTKKNNELLNIQNKITIKEKILKEDKKIKKWQRNNFKETFFKLRNNENEIKEETL